MSPDDQEVQEFFEVRLLSRRVAVLKDLPAYPVTLHVNKARSFSRFLNLSQNANRCHAAGCPYDLAQVAKARGILDREGHGGGHRAGDPDRIFEPLFTTKASGHAPVLGWRWCRESCGAITATNPRGERARMWEYFHREAAVVQPRVWASAREAQRC